MTNFTGWIAYLSNGDTITESEPELGKKTPWQQLLTLCRGHEGLDVNRISLIVHGVQIMSMPNKQCDGFFQARETRKEFFGSMGEKGSAETHYQGIGSIVGDLVFITWINLAKPEHISASINTDVRPLESCKIHTTLS